VYGQVNGHGVMRLRIPTADSHLSIFFSSSHNHLTMWLITSKAGSWLMLHDDATASRMQCQMQCRMQMACMRFERFERAEPVSSAVFGRRCRPTAGSRILGLADKVSFA